MSWYSKVAWSEGLFLRPHHLQQSDRYLEHLVRAGSGTSRRTRGASRISRSIAIWPSRASSRVRRAAGRHAGRHAVRYAGRQPAARADRRARRRRRVRCLAFDADRRAEHARGRRPGSAESASRFINGRRDLHRLFDLAVAHRGGNRRRLSAPRLRTAQDAQSRASSVSGSRADHRSARQDDRLR